MPKLYFGAETDAQTLLWWCNDFSSQKITLAINSFVFHLLTQHTCDKLTSAKVHII